jgi:hypothetical protein
MNLAAETPILTYRQHLDHFGAWVDDTLEITEDGIAWRWALAPSRPDRLDEAGTYRLSVPASEVIGLRELAATLAALDRGGDTREGHIRHTVEIDGRVVELPDDPAAPTVLGDALRRLRELAGRTLAAPDAVVRLTVRLSPSAAPGRVSPTFVVESVGSSTVRIQTPPDGYTLMAPGERGPTQAFRGDVSQTAGFVDTGGSMLGGLLTPADVAPGSRVTILFLDALPAPQPGGLVARVDGLIGVRGPASDDDFPETQFRVSAVVPTVTAS